MTRVELVYPESCTTQGGVLSIVLRNYNVVREAWVATFDFGDVGSTAGTVLSVDTTKTAAEGLTTLRVSAPAAAHAGVVPVSVSSPGDTNAVVLFSMQYVAAVSFVETVFPLSGTILGGANASPNPNHILTPYSARN